jgi:predicted RNA-binding Zn-ribbon protein involved in translation (DUF1610 family)
METGCSDGTRFAIALGVMPVQSCPSCGRLIARFLEAPSINAYVAYYRCDDCGHVWAIGRDRERPAVQHITPLRPSVTGPPKR